MPADQDPTAARKRKREIDRRSKAKVRAADPERHREAARQWRAANPDRYRELVREAGQRYRDKHRDENREMLRQRAAAWSAANPERRQAISHRNRLKAYGLTPEAFEVLLAAQGGGCALCGARSSGRNGDRGRLLIDHCHDTGVVRGLLCHFCNVLLGMAKDSATRLRRAADYLERSSTRPVRDQE